MGNSLNRLLSAFFISVSAVSSWHEPVNAREVISINDGWSFSTVNDTARTPVHLPHTWNSDAYMTRDYFRGKGFYTKNITIPENFKGKRIYLKFDGAASKSEVSIDSKAVGSHTGAYSPHILDVTDFVSPGSLSTLSVIVDNSDRDVPPHSADFTFMGGLYRDAWLIALPETHFDLKSGPDTGFKVVPSLKENGTGDLTISGTLINDSDRNLKRFLEIKISDKSGAVIAKQKQAVSIRAKNRATFRVKFEDLNNIMLWTPENPELYRVNVTLGDGKNTIDSSWCYTGFRSFGFDDKGSFLLNGKPYKLRGMCRHQDMAPMGIALTDEQHRRDIQLIKELGANFIRISHYPQDDTVLELCDRLGLIAWEEIPVIDYVPDSEQFALNCETMLREMIRSHYNHTSVAMWGYMNEILLRMPQENRDATAARTRQLAERLEEVLLEEDSTRLSTMAFHGSDIYHSTGLGEITDVKGWNLYQGWYGGDVSDFGPFLSRQHREHPSHRLIVSEYGAGSDRRLHSLNPEPFDFSIEYQQKYLERYLPVIEDSVFIAGASHWNFIDFSSANRAESMPHINNKGIVTNNRQKKDVYYYFKSLWHNLPDTVAYIASRDWAYRTEIIGENEAVYRPIKVYTNLPAVAMRINGTDLGVRNTENRTAVFDVPLKAGKNILELYPTDSRSIILDATVINLNGIKSHDGVIDCETGEFAVNVGSNCYFRSEDSGMTWLPDREYSSGQGYGHVGGKRTACQDEILLIDDEPLLQHCLTDLDYYRIDVAPGLYEVELLFAELSEPSPMSAYMLGRNAGSDSRETTEMDIEINGRRVETSFAPSLSSGNKAMVKRRYFTEVTDMSGISVKFTPANGGNTSLSAIKIRKL